MPKVEIETSSPYVLRQLLKPIKDEYDWILLDCPSQMGIITVNAFTAATSIIVPISCDTYAAEGLLQLIKMVEQNLREQYGAMVFPTKIRELATIVHAPIMSIDIISYDPKCNGARDYTDLLKEIEARLQ